jgi:hypothetical protein
LITKLRKFFVKMDRDFYTDSFEQLLKEQADRFTMKPTKRIWHSIYNNLHPGRKWPSVAISLLLVTSILVLGYLHTNQSRKLALANNLAGLQSGQAGAQTAGVPNRSAAPAPAFAAQPATLDRGTEWTAPNAATAQTPATGTQAGSSSAQSPVQPLQQLINRNLHRRTSRASSIMAVHGGQQQTNTRADGDAPARPGATETSNGNNKTNGGNNGDNNGKDNNNGTVPNSGQDDPAITGTVPGKTAINVTVPQPADADNSEPGTASAVVDANRQSAAVATAKSPLRPATGKTFAPSAEDMAWMDDYAQSTMPSRRNAWKTKTSWQLYITPSVTYRTLFDNSVAEGSTSVATNLINPFVRQQGIENSVEHKPGIGFEFGGALVYQAGKKWQLKLGTQFNYTSYVAMGNKINHPLNTSITLNNLNTGGLEVESRSASVSNTPGSNHNRLNHYTVQLSLPIGFAYRLAGKDDLKFYAGASIQPTLLLAGSSPLLSSDKLFYVDNNLKLGNESMIRNFNMALGLETYASYNMGSFTFLAGPQLRYQLRNTNSNRYTIGEKLYNIGLKLGIAKKL